MDVWSKNDLFLKYVLFTGREVYIEKTCAWGRLVAEVQIQDWAQLFFIQTDQDL